MVDEPGEMRGARGAGEGPRSRLTDIADQTVVHTGGEESKGHGTVASGATASVDVDTTVDARADASPAEAIFEETAVARTHRHRFLAELGEFRRSRVLVPVATPPGPDAGEVPLTVDMGEVRWILAFTGEAALARYAVARGGEARAWRYRSVWGAALLDAAVPAVAESGVPCGVLVNAADGGRALVLPPVRGVVPEAVSVHGPGRFTEEGR